MQRTMWVVKQLETGKYLRVVTKVEEGKTVHTASWVDDIAYANRAPDTKAANMMFLCSFKQLNEDSCEIQEVLVSVTEVK